MALLKTRVETFEMDQSCDKCSEGFMRPTGQVLTSNPLQYPHRCNKCGEEKTYTAAFPFTVYEKVRV